MERCFEGIFPALFTTFQFPCVYIFVKFLFLHLFNFLFISILCSFSRVPYNMLFLQCLAYQIVMIGFLRFSSFSSYSVLFLCCILEGLSTFNYLRDLSPILVWRQIRTRPSILKLTLASFGTSFILVRSHVFILQGMCSPFTNFNLTSTTFMSSISTIEYLNNLELVQSDKLSTYLSNSELI